MVLFYSKQHRNHIQNNISKVFVMKIIILTSKKWILKLLFMRLNVEDDINDMSFWALKKMTCRLAKGLFISYEINDTFFLFGKTTCRFGWAAFDSYWINDTSFLVCWETTRRLIMAGFLWNEIMTRRFCFLEKWSIVYLG